MIKVLVAEDELPILRGIKKLIEQINSNFCVVCMAKNGKEAVEFIQNNKVDVVFTDINMPIMDGIAVLDYIYENKSKIKTVVISGYNEFSYVKSAIKYGAQNYILKPIDTTELAELLEKIEREFKTTDYHQKQEIINNLLFNKNIINGINDIYLGDYVYCLYFCAGPYPIGEEGELTLGKAYWDTVDLQSIINQAVGSQEVCWIYNVYSLSEYIAIIALHDETLLQSVVKQIYFLLPKAIPITISVSDQITDIRDMAKIRSQMCLQTHHGCLYAHSSIIWSHSDQSLGFCIDTVTEEQIKHSLAKRSYHTFKSVMLHLKEQFKSEQLKQRNLEHILQYISFLVQSELKQYDVSLSDSSINELICNSYNYDSLMNDYLVICRDIIHSEIFDTGNKEDLMASVDEYITSHISSQLSTKFLSQKFGLVAPYLSKLFKDYKGMSPSQYIQKLRLDAAKKLLIEKPDMLMKDISEILGYNNSLYFSKTFKKNVGISPSEYRQYHFSKK